MKYGIAYTTDGGHPDSIPPTPIVGWKQKDGSDQTWDTYGAALEANDLDGWRGYVRYYPSGKRVNPTDE